MQLADVVAASRSVAATSARGAKTATIAALLRAAGPDVAAGVMQLIPGPYRSGMSNSVTIDAATPSALLNGLSYVNLHTKAHPKGEARAQMTVSPSPGM